MPWGILKSPELPKAENSLYYDIFTTKYTYKGNTEESTILPCFPV